MNLQPEVSAYYHRIHRARGDIHLATLLALDKLVQTAKADGWWKNVVEAYPFCGTNLNAALCKLVTPDACPEMLTNHGFAKEHFSECGGFGITAGNTSRWLETGFVPAEHGLAKDNLCLIVGNASESTIAGDGSGKTIGDLKPDNAGECGIGYFQWQNGISIISGSTFIWQTTARNAKVAAINATGGGALSVACDGIALESWAASNAGSGGLADPIGLWKCIRYGATRYDNGVLGCVMFAHSMPPALAKLATAAVSRFERSVRAVYNTPKALFWGDSITAHQGTSNATNLSAWSSRVARRLGFWEWNMGSLSECLTTTTNQICALEQLPDILATDAQTIFLMFGTNDGQVSVSATAYQAALETITAAIVGANKRLVICSPCWSSSTTYTTTVQREYAAVCEAVAEAYGCVFADTNDAIASQSDPSACMADTNHPNDLGHQLMANCIITAMHS